MSLQGWLKAKDAAGVQPHLLAPAVQCLRAKETELQQVGSGLMQELQRGWELGGFTAARERNALFSLTCRDSSWL